jgi:hypothetical protein
MQPPAKALRLAVTIATTLYTALLVVSGVDLPGATRKAVGFLPTVLGFGFVVFHLWLWRLPGIHRVVGRPWVAGTWIATITPHPDSRIPAGGNRGPIEAVVTIEQSYWMLAVRQQTPESSSYSTSAALRPEGDSKVRGVLAYTYRTTPQQQHRDRNPAQTGACQLVATGRTPMTLTGTYWTDRFTTGDMTLRHLSRRTDVASLDEARALDQ